MRTARSAILVPAVALVLALVAGACSGDDDDAEGPPTTDADGDDAALAFAAHLDGVLDDDGALPADDALQLFAAVFEALPGVEVDDDVADLAERGAYEPSLALRAAVELLPTLDADQAAVVERVAFGEDGALLDGGVVAVDATDDATPATPDDEGDDEGALGDGELAAAALPGAPFETEREAEASALVRRFAGEIAGHLGRPLGIPARVVELSRAEASIHFPGGEAASATAVPNGAGGVDACLVRLNPNAARPLDETADPRFAAQVAHEVFHCFQYSLFPGDATTASRWPMWVKEGGPAWAGEELVGGSGQSSSWWINWLRFSERDLVRRSYDAIGFWSLLDAAGVDTWRRLDQVMSNVATAYTTALGGDTDAVLTRWGSSLARRAALGAEWDTTGPGVVDEAPSALDVPVRVDADPVTVNNVLAAAHSGRLVRFEAEGDVVTVAVENVHARVRLPGATDALMAGSGSTGWCLNRGGCVCPDGEPVAGPAGPLVPAEAGDAFVGVAASTSGGRVTIGAQSLDAACESRPATTTTIAPVGGACLIGSWTGGPWVVPTGESSGGNGARLVLEADGTGTVDYGGMNPAVMSAPSGGPPVETHVLFTGSGAVTWRADDATVAITYADPAAFTATSRVIFDGSPVSEQSRTFAQLLAEGGAPLSSAPYTCGDDGFRLVMPVPGGEGTFELPFQG